MPKIQIIINLQTRVIHIHIYIVWFMYISMSLSGLGECKSLIKRTIRIRAFAWKISGTKMHANKLVQSHMQPNI